MFQSRLSKLKDEMNSLFQDHNGRLRSSLGPSTLDMSVMSVQVPSMKSSKVAPKPRTDLLTGAANRSMMEDSLVSQPQRLSQTIPHLNLRDLDSSHNQSFLNKTLETT